MLTRRRMLLAACALSLLSASPAHAATRDPITVAQTAWHGSPCTNRLSVYWDHSIFTRYGYVGMAEGVTSFEPFKLNSCDVAIDPAYWGHNGYYERLTVILHEAGHLAGKQHTKNGIMSPDHHGCAPVCQYFPAGWPR